MSAIHKGIRLRFRFRIRPVELNRQLFLIMSELFGNPVFQLEPFILALVIVVALVDQESDIRDLLFEVNLIILGVIPIQTMGVIDFLTMFYPVYYQFVTSM